MEKGNEKTVLPNKAVPVDLRKILLSLGTFGFELSDIIKGDRCLKSVHWV
jgi:hypothetical protein